MRISTGTLVKQKTNNKKKKSTISNVLKLDREKNNQEKQ